MRQHGEESLRRCAVGLRRDQQPCDFGNLLLERLKASAPSRVVVVASAAHEGATIDFADLHGNVGMFGMRAYSQSKLANVMFTYELARRLAGTGVTATVLHPGVTRTNFGAEDQAAFFKVMQPLVRPFLKPPADGRARADGADHHSNRGRGPSNGPAYLEFFSGSLLGMPPPASDRHAGGAPFPTRSGRGDSGRGRCPQVRAAIRDRRDRRADR